MTIDKSAFVHRKAYVENSTIGARTKVWQFASVIRGAHIGCDCVVASGATLDGCSFGDRTIICQNVAAGPGFVVGSDVFIGPNVTLCNDIWPRANKKGFDADRLRHGDIAIFIEDGASVGANAVVLPGVIIGAGAMISAGAVVSHDVPPGKQLLRDGRMVTICDEDKKLKHRMRFAARHLPALGAEQKFPHLLAPI